MALASQKVVKWLWVHSSTVALNWNSVRKCKKNYYCRICCSIGFPFLVSGIICLLFCVLSFLWASRITLTSDLSSYQGCFQALKCMECCISFQIKKKIDKTEISWALGAMFDLYNQQEPHDHGQRWQLSTKPLNTQVVYCPWCTNCILVTLCLVTLAMVYSGVLAWEIIKPLSALAVLMMVLMYPCDQYDLFST